MRKYYIFWADGVKTGFVDYDDDFVTDDLEDRAMFFNSEKSAEEHIVQLQQKYPNCCSLSVALYRY